MVLQHVPRGIGSATNSTDHRYGLRPHADVVPPIRWLVARGHLFQQTTDIDRGLRQRAICVNLLVALLIGVIAERQRLTQSVDDRRIVVLVPGDRSTISGVRVAIGIVAVREAGASCLRDSMLLGDVIGPCGAAGHIAATRNIAPSLRCQ